MNNNDLTTYQKFGNRIKELRKINGVTQKDLSSSIGVTQSTIVAIEKGQRRIPLNMLTSIADFFSITVDELIDTNKLLNRELTEESKSTETIPFVSKTSYERHSLWIKHVEETNFSDEEFKEIMDFAKFVISKRKR